MKRFHRTLEKVVSDNQKNWDEHLPVVMAAYRASRHESTEFSPNLLMFGRETLAPLDVLLVIPVGDRKHYESCSDFVDHKITTMRNAYRLAREALGCRAERSKRITVSNR